MALVVLIVLLKLLTGQLKLDRIILLTERIYDNRKNRRKKKQIQW